MNYRAAIAISFLCLLASARDLRAVTNTLQDVNPPTAPQGTNGMLVLFTLNTTPPPPATNVPISAVTIGSVAGSARQRVSQYVVSAMFNIPGGEAPGTKDVRITFAGGFTGYKADGFTVTTSSVATVPQVPSNGAYAVVDTGQTNSYDDSRPIAPPAPGQPFYGQDAQHAGRQPAYRDNGDGTVSDLVSGLMWMKARGSKITWADACTGADACTLAGYNDWRMPTIRELYSLILFTGANGHSMTSAVGYVSFINSNYFDFAYGSGTGDERVIDCQDWSLTEYVSTTMMGDETVFGVNFGDGRIKGYPKHLSGGGSPTGNTLYARFVRGNPSYGISKLVNNGNGTITDKATGLMWSRDDSGTGLNWSNALAWVQARNAVRHLGHDDWRMPDIKELHTILDYARSPDTSGSAAIDRMFNCTVITNEGGALDFPFYWSGTTHMDGTSNQPAAYLAFGRGLGWMEMPPGSGNWTLLDVHGAGTQRSDPKTGDPAAYPRGRGPQGDVVRIMNHVRMVRDIPATRAWRFAFVGDTHVPLTTVPAEIAAAAANDDARFLFVAGDLVQGGAGASTSELREQLHAWFDAMTPARSAGVGVYAVRGNHEDDVNGDAGVWFESFAGADALPANGPGGESNLTWSVIHSNALFVGLDVYTNIHRVNQQWLDGQLNDNTRPHVFVFGHEPAFKTFHTDCLGSQPAARNALWSSLAAAGARVYLCGHDHLLNVARIDDSDGNSSSDVYQCIVGTGGSTNWPPTSYNYNGTNSPYSPVNVTNITRTYGYLLVEIAGPDAGDLGVTVTWKVRTYDTNTDSYIYVAVTGILAYTATDRRTDSVGDGIPDWWRGLHFGNPGTATNAVSCADGDPDGDGANNYDEHIAGTDPGDAGSQLKIVAETAGTGQVEITWTGGTGAGQYIESSTSLSGTDVAWHAVFTNAPPTLITNTIAVPAGQTPASFLRVRAVR